MARLECAQADACQQYCQALRTQGVEVVAETGCNVPDMFNVDNTGVSFDPKMSGEASIDSNPDLINVLGGSLFMVLNERAARSAELLATSELTTAYTQSFEARLDLWRAMIGATKQGRTFTDAELCFYQDRFEQVDSAINETAASSGPEILLGAQAAADRATLNEYKLLFDEQMIGTVDKLVGNLMDGKPTLIVGDTGIAKTQAAKFVAELCDPSKEPVIISGHGDMMSNELIGQMEQDKDTRVFAFKEGKLIKAMREGRPVIIDEVNIGDQSVVMRLQDILLRRPGERIMLQENGGDSIEIQPGFVVFATANEASARYQHRNVLDPAFRDRYEVVQVQYPDNASKNPVEEVPKSLMRLALASAVDEKGVLSRHINAPTLERFVRLSHITQHLYSVPACNARVSNLNIGAATSNFLDDEPAMTDCITPRAVVDTIQRCAAGNKPGMSLDNQIERLIVGLDQAGSTKNQKYARRALTLLQNSSK